jgi:threonine synthase
MDYHYVCSECGCTYEINRHMMVCAQCSKKQEADEPLRGVLEVSIEPGVGGNFNKHFDIFDFLPVEKKFFPPIPVGSTPLWAPRNLREKTGFKNLYLKDDSLNPTGSLKDRASYLVAAFAVREKIKDVVVASTGNAASSMAGVGAAAALNIKIFIPASAPQAKRVQALQYGADVVLVDGNYDRAYELSMEYTKEHGVLSRNTAYNPLTIEGKKTAALEIFKQLEAVPDYMFVPTGDGVILGGVYKGFKDLKNAGLTDKIPVIYAVQAEGSSSISLALEKGGFDRSYRSKTIADSIAVDIPRNGYYALKQLNAYGGRCVAVEDAEIIDAQKELASTAGLFAEPAASAAYAGFVKVADDIPPVSSVVLLITGSGLKDINAAMQGVMSKTVSKG